MEMLYLFLFIITSPNAHKYTNDLFSFYFKCTINLENVTTMYTKHTHLMENRQYTLFGMFEMCVGSTQFSAQQLYHF